MRLGRIRNNGRITTDHREAIADPDLDAVDICLILDLHASVAIESLQAGKPALVQMTRGCYATEDYKRNRPWFLDAKQAAGGGTQVLLD